MGIALSLTRGRATVKKTPTTIIWGYVTENLRELLNIFFSTFYVHPYPTLLFSHDDRNIHRQIRNSFQLFDHVENWTNESES